jgi:hypothetical protein
VDTVPDPILLRKSGSTGNRTHTSESVARNSDHWTTEVVPSRVPQGENTYINLGSRQRGTTSTDHHRKLPTIFRTDHWVERSRTILHVAGSGQIIMHLIHTKLQPLSSTTVIDNPQDLAMLLQNMTLDINRLQEGLLDVISKN